MDRDELQKEINSWTAAEKKHFNFPIMIMIKQCGSSIELKEFQEVIVEPLKDKNLFVPIEKPGWYKLSQKGIEIAILVNKGELILK